MANVRALENRQRAVSRSEVEQIETAVARLVGRDGKETEVPEPIYNLIRDILPALKNGQTMVLVPAHKSLTTQQAADILGMSRPFLKKILDRQEIPYQKVGTHRRIKFVDVMAYQERRDAERQGEMDEILATSIAMGAYKKTTRLDVRPQE